jgi:hypothetical protein
MISYFASDGNYGDAQDILIVHTGDFTESDWEQIETAPDQHRLMIAETIAESKRNSQSNVRLLGL